MKLVPAQPCPLRADEGSRRPKEDLAAKAALEQKDLQVAQHSAEEPDFN